MFFIFNSLNFLLQSINFFSSPSRFVMILLALLSRSFLFMMSLILFIQIFPQFLLHFILFRLGWLLRLWWASWRRCLLNYISRRILVVRPLWLLWWLNSFFLSLLSLPLFFRLTWIISIRFLCFINFLNWNNQWYIFLSFNNLRFLLKGWCLRSLDGLQNFISHFINFLLKVIYFFPLRNLIIFVVIAHIYTIIIWQSYLKSLSTYSFNYFLILFDHYFHSIELN